VPLSDDLRRANAAAWDRVFAHPCVRAIGGGSLPVERFRYYLAQDYLFLVEYGRVLALAVARAPDLGTMGRLARVLESTLNDEMDLHRTYSAGFGVSAEALESAPPSPTTRAYTDFLVATAYSGSLVEILFALLPCAYGYHEIGLRLRGGGGLREDNPYAEWIRAYASEEYGSLATWLRDLADVLAEGLPQREVKVLEQHYVEGLRHELAFWEAAWLYADAPV
jgi:thiaminase/transcriptional activator TenA